MKKIIIISVIALFLLLFFYRLFYNYDVKPFNIDDYKISRVELDPAKNAFTYLVQATNIDWGEDGYDYNGYMTNDELNVAAVIPIIETNKASIDLINKAIECKQLHVPKITSFTNLMPYVSQFRHQARFKKVEAKLFFSQGKEEEAFKTALGIMHLGDMQKNSGGAVINYLVAIAVEGVGADTLEDFIPLTSLSSDKLIGYAEILNTYTNDNVGFINSANTELIVSCNIIDDVAAGKTHLSDVLFTSVPKFIDLCIPAESYFFMPNQTKKIMADHYLLLIKSADKPYSKIDLKYFDDIADDCTPSFKNIILKDNYVGRALNGMIMPAYSGLLNRKCRSTLYKNALQLLLVIKAYQVDNSKLPESLNDLVPKYIKSIPEDPFDGNNIRYNKEKRIIYSVGENGKDDGGYGIDKKTDGRKRWTAEDIIFSF